MPKNRFSPFLTILCGIMLILSACSDDSVDLNLPPNPTTSTGSNSGAATCLPYFRQDADYLLVMGDVQTYVANTKNIPCFNFTMLWAVNQVRRGAPVKAMLYVGDLTDDNTHEQWQRFRQNFIIGAAEIPTVTVSGNHDYDWLRDKIYFVDIKDRRTCHLSTYADSPLLRENLVDTFRPDSIDNVIMKCTLAGKRIDIVALEFGPRPEVLEWASAHIAAHPERRYIIMTHELLHRSGRFISEGAFNHAQQQFDAFGIPRSTPDEVFKKLAYPNSNVIAMLCGHNGFSQFNTTQTNKDGDPVPIIMFNIQYQVYGGDTMIEMWEFPHDSQEVNIHIIETRTSKILPDPDPADLIQDTGNPTNNPTSFTFTYR